MVDIGNRIRQVRKERQVTLIELSNTTGVAQATLSRIETGDMIGTVDCHQKIANALGMNLSELYVGLDDRNKKTQMHKPEKTETTSRSNDRVRTELLTSKALKKKLLPSKITIKALSKTEPEKSEKSVEKFIYCLDGDVLIHLDNESYRLKPDESLYFDGSLGHWLENKSSKTAKLLSISSPPA
jgi:transcriptional regulator with XRE-family HTH domain